MTREAPDTVIARTPYCMVSAIMRPLDGRTRVVLVARGSWTRYHVGVALPYPAAKIALRRLLAQITRDIPTFVRDYFPPEPDLSL